MTQDDRAQVWIYRLALAHAAGNGDAYDETIDEINAADACWSCLAQEAVGALMGAVWDRFTTPPPPGAPADLHGITNVDKATSWIQDRLDSELDRIEHDV